ncbi:MAG: sugar phosphate nucleotidyltransferase [Armatimonadota bacterium]
MPKGMILAAGRGTRLGPLTESLPKPLLPVANQPVMAHGLHCLHRLGITDVCVNVSYRAQQIMDTFGDGHEYGIALQWSVEDEPTGTAGGFKGVQDRLGDDVVVVIAGDAMLDVDLSPLLAAHQASGAFASLATVRVEDPSRYGVVVTGEDGRIIRFQEKPAPGTEISRQANTGIYIFDPGIFDLIPAGEFADFALHIFPEILRQGLPFYAHPVQGYWTDIGNPGEYLLANLDYLAGRICVEGRGCRVDSSLIMPDAVTGKAQLTNCIIGDNAALDAGCKLTNCVVWPETTLRKPLSLSSAVLTPWGCYQVRDNVAHPLDEQTVSA